MSYTQSTDAIKQFGTVGVALIAGLALLPGNALADPPVSMAPPLGTATSIGSQDGAPTQSTSLDSVFNYADVPINQQVPLNRAVFDQGGYQLFDTAGETIVVPFTNQNLYVMKFALSPNDTLYFVNENGTPTLYVPRNGYLENATVPGAKWYPFSDKFQPTTPVFLGIAPSYTEYIETGWYPDTVLYGGYYSTRPFLAGGFFAPTFGLTFLIGGRPYHSWHDYHSYIVVHPSPFRFGYSNRPVYSIAPRPRIGQGFHGYVGFHGNTGYHGDSGFHSDHDFRPNRPAFHGADPRFSGNHVDRYDLNRRDDHDIRNNNGWRDNHGTRPSGDGIFGNHPFNSSSNIAPDHGFHGSNPRFTGNPNFSDSRDRGPGPVLARPSSGTNGTRADFQGGIRTDPTRRDGNRSPGGVRGGGRFSGGGSRSGHNR